MSGTVELHTLILCFSLFLSLTLVLILSLKLKITRNPPNMRLPVGRAVVGDHARAYTRRPVKLARQPALASIPEESRSYSTSQDAHNNSSLSRRHPQHQEAVAIHREGALTRQTGELPVPSTSVSSVSAMIQPWKPARSNTPPPSLRTPASAEDPRASPTSRPGLSGVGRLAQGGGGLGHMLARGTPPLPGSSRETSLAPSSPLSSLTPSPRSSLSTPPSSSFMSASTTISPAASGLSVRAKTPSSPFFQSKAPYLLAGLPDPSECVDLQVGDGFLHTATGFSPAKYQLWLWTVDDDGCTFWKPVAIGHTRDDGKRLSLSPKNKTPRWVTEKHFRQVTPSRTTGDAKTTGKTVRWA